MNKGRFITVEGIEGAGKSSAMQTLAGVLQGKGVAYVQTREPGGTRLGEELRALLLGHGHAGMAEDAELLLMFAARAEHLQQVILPAVRQGKWVLCDRFTDASFAYQGAGRGIPAERIARLENWVQGELRPDLTLLLDVPVVTGLERAGRRSTPDRFERETQAFFERVRSGYLDLARRQPQRFRIVDAAERMETVSANIVRVLEEAISGWH